MPYCGVVGCRSGAKNLDEKFKFYFLPKSEGMRKLWLEKMNRDFNATEDTKVCNKHFRDEDFIHTTKRGKLTERPKLKKSAFPSLFLKPPDASNTRQTKNSSVQDSREQVDFAHSYSLPAEKRRKKDIENEANQAQIEESDEEPDEEPDVEIQVISNAPNYLDETPSVTLEMIMNEEGHGTELVGIDDGIQSQEAVRESLNETILRLQMTIASLEKKNDELQKKADCLEKLFHADQVYKILYPDSKKTWSDITLEMAIALYYKVGSTGYNYLRDVLKWPLPCPSVIQSNMRRVKFKPGNDGCLDILKLIALKTRELPENERFYCLVIDEMATKSKLEWDPTSGEFVGFPTIPPHPNLVQKRVEEGIDQTQILACHVFNAMIVLTSAKMKQIASYQHTDRSWDPEPVDDWLRHLIRDIYEICGLVCDSITMDMGKNNISL